MERTCRYCDALRQCPYLSDSAGGFVPERLITVGNYRECDRWSPISPRQDSFRLRLCDSSAFVGAMKFVHSDLPGMMMMDLVLKEMKEARMDGDTPDFAGMLVGGMSVADREGQLRYETDDSGNILLNEEGKPTYRPSYQLKQFVTSKDSHVGLELPVVWHWTTNQLVDHILKVEVEQGLIVKPKKAKAASKVVEETKMAGEGRVVVHHGRKSASAPAANPQPPPAPGAPVSVQVGGPGKVAAPPMRTGTPPLPPGSKGAPGPVGRPPMGGPRLVNPKPMEEAPAAVPEQSAPAAAASPDLVGVVQQVVEAALDNLGNELRVAVGTEVKKQLEGLRNELVQQIDVARVQMLQAVTLAYDVAVQTGGQYWYPVMNENGEQKIDKKTNQPMFQQAHQCWDFENYILDLAPKGE